MPIGDAFKDVVVKFWVYMSVLLYVHLKNDDFSISLLLPLYQGMLLPILTVFNCMQKAVTSVLHSWSIGFKKPRTILLMSSSIKK